MKSLYKSSAAFAALTASTLPAFAHHPMGGKTPSSLMEGVLSGIGHPIIGLDHLAFVVAVGVAAVLIGQRFTAPLYFIIATLMGTLLHVQGISLPFVEVAIAISVAALGVMIMSGKTLPNAAYAIIFSLAGLFHGHAYGEAIFGAEATPMIAYLLGFGVTQYLIAIAAGYVIVDLIGKGNAAFENASARLAGAMVAGAGGVLLGEHILSAIFI